MGIASYMVYIALCSTRCPGITKPPPNALRGVATLPDNSLTIRWQFIPNVLIKSLDTKVSRPLISNVVSYFNGHVECVRKSSGDDDCFPRPKNRFKEHTETDGHYKTESPVENYISYTVDDGALLKFLECEPTQKNQ